MPYRDPEQRRKYQTEYYRNRLHTDPAFREDHRKRVRKTKEKTAAAVKPLIEAFKSNGCAACPEKTLCCLTAHHVDPSDKLFNIGDAGNRGYSPKSVRKELDKCVCLCMNCHAKVHEGLLDISGVWSSGSSSAS